MAAFRSLLSSTKTDDENNDDDDVEGGGGIMSSIPFDRYDEEFEELSNQIRSGIDSLEERRRRGGNDNDGGGGEGGGGTAKDLELTSNLLSQCDDLLKQMSVEARGVDHPSTKRKLLDKVKSCKTELRSLRSDYDSSRTALERESLLLSSSSSSSRRGRHSSNNKNHQERLLESTNDTLQSQTDTLEHAKRVMADTEHVALEITGELERNRETIQSARLRVQSVSGLTNQARRIVRNMNRREVQQKLVMYVVAIILLIVVVFIFFGMR